jgi:hypothetical protein
VKLGRLLVGLGLAGGAFLLVSRRAAAAGPELPQDVDPGDAAGWVRLEDAPGLAIRAPSRSWTSPAVRDLLHIMGEVAAQLGGALQVGDVGPEVRGSPNPPHKSHRWGRDMDLAYTLDAYPTPDDVPVDLRVLEVLEAIAPMIEKIGVHATRLPAFAGRPWKTVAWEGHAHHMHLRLRPELVAEPAGFVALGDQDETGDA